MNTALAFLLMPLIIAFALWQLWHRQSMTGMDDTTC